MKESVSDPIATLMEEHKVVLGKLDSLEEALSAIEGSPTSEAVKRVNEIINSIERDFSLHSLQKEEKALFPVLEAYIPREGGPIGVMLMEHQDLKSSIQEFKRDLRDSKWKSLIELGDHIILVLRNHINKEDNILYPMAEMHFSRFKEQRDSVVRKMKEIEAQA